MGGYRREGRGREWEKGRGVGMVKGKEGGGRLRGMEKGREAEGNGEREGG